MAFELEIKRGDTFELTVTALDGASGEDLSTYTYTAQVRLTTNDSLQTTPTIDDSDAANGVLVLTVPAATTTNWPTTSTLSMDIQFTDGSGKVTSSDTFIINVIKDYTY